MSKIIKIKTRKSAAKKVNTVSLTRSRKLRETADSPVDQILNLQKTAGNQAVQRLYKSGVLQAKLKTGKTNDKYEQEADRVADIVMRMLEPKESRVNSHESPDKKENENVQAKGNNPNTAVAAPGIESSIDSLRGGGEPLPESTRKYFEPRFGADFSGVRVHTEKEANEAASSVNSKAFTIGNNIVFNTGNYSPETSGGKKLLAHELTHVIQQTNKPIRDTLQRQPWKYVGKERELTPTPIPPGLNFELKNHQLYAHTTTNKDIDSVINLMYILNLYYKVNFKKTLYKAKMESKRKGKKDGDRVSIKVTEMLPDALQEFLKRTEKYFSDYRTFLEKMAKTPNPIDKRIYRTPEEIFEFYGEKIKRAKTKKEENDLRKKEREVVDEWYKGYTTEEGERHAVPVPPVEHRAACHNLMTLIISGTPKGVQPGQYGGTAYAVPGFTSKPETGQIVKSLATSWKGKGPHRVVPRGEVAVGDIAVFKARAPGYKRRTIVHSAVVIRVSGKEIELLEKTNDLKPMATRTLKEVLNVYKKDRGTVKFLAPALAGLPARSKSGLGNKPPTESFVLLKYKAPEDTFVLFNYDSIALLPHEDIKLFAIIAMFKEPVSLFVHGYASIEGTKAYNLNLSAHRAVTIKKALTPQLPSGSKTEAAAHGETSIFGSKPDNRRVSIQILSPVKIPKDGSAEKKDTKTVEILNTQNYTSPEYRGAIETWPDSMKIWPQLKSRKAKENFIRYIVKFDLTNCRPYEAENPKVSAECKNFERAKEEFENLCTGFAVQMYVRYSFEAEKLTAKDIANLQSAAFVYAAKIPAKFRMPVFVGGYPGHAFNAILVDPDKTDINSYIFLEPQTDEIFEAKSTIFKDYAKFRILEISKLSSVSEGGGYGFTNVADFLMGSSGVFSHYKLTSEQRIAFDNISSDIIVAEDNDTWTHSVVKRGLTFETYIKEKMDRYRYKDEIIAFVGKFLIGRKFRRSPTAKYEILTRAKFIKLMGRPSLEKLIPAK